MLTRRQYKCCSPTSHLAFNVGKLHSPVAIDSWNFNISKTLQENLKSSWQRCKLIQFYKHLTCENDRRRFQENIVIQDVTCKNFHITESVLTTFLGLYGRWALTWSGTSQTFILWWLIVPSLVERYRFRVCLLLTRNLLWVFCIKFNYDSILVMF